MTKGWVRGKKANRLTSTVRGEEKNFVNLTIRFVMDQIYILREKHNSNNNKNIEAASFVICCITTIRFSYTAEAEER